jgi:hypothetical protein
MDRQSSTSGNYHNCSKIFDPHGDGSCIAPWTNLTLSEWFQSDSDLSAIAAVALLTAASFMPRSYSPSTERRAAGTVIGP